MRGGLFPLFSYKGRNMKKFLFSWDGFWFLVCLVLVMTWNLISGRPAIFDFLVWFPYCVFAFNYSIRWGAYQERKKQERSGHHRKTIETLKESTEKFKKDVESFQESMARVGKLAKGSADRERARNLRNYNRPSMERVELEKFKKDVDDLKDSLSKEGKLDLIGLCNETLEILKRDRELDEKMYREMQGTKREKSAVKEKMTEQLESLDNIIADSRIMERLNKEQNLKDG